MKPISILRISKERVKFGLIIALFIGVLGFVYGYLSGPCACEITLINVADNSGVIRDSQALQGITRSGFLSEAALTELVCSPRLWREVQASTGSNRDKVPALKPEVTIDPERKSIGVKMRGDDAQTLTLHLNLLCQYLNDYLKRLCVQSASNLAQFQEAKLVDVDDQLDQVSAELQRFLSAMGVVDFELETSQLLHKRIEFQAQAENLNMEKAALEIQVNSLVQELIKNHPSLLSVRQELDQALLRYTDAHPKVQELKSTLEMLERKMQDEQSLADPDISFQGSALSQSLYTKMVDLRTQKITAQKQLDQVTVLREELDKQLERLPEKQLRFARLTSRYESLQQTRDALEASLQKSRLLHSNPPASFQLLEPLNLQDVSYTEKYRRGVAMGTMGTCGAFFSIMIWFIARSKRDRRIRSETDLLQVTQLPLLARLGDLDTMTEDEIEQWAFQTLTTMKGRLNRSQNEALICGFISSCSGEGKSTWVKLLAKAARKRGYRVVTVFAHPEESLEQGDSAWDRYPESNSSSHSLSVPAQLSQTLMTQSLDPEIEITVLDWVWNLDCRAQWQEALRKCRTIDNLVVLVELPPASSKEGILLSENISNVIWLCGKDLANMDQTRTQIDMLKFSRTELAGAVFNHAPENPRTKASCLAIPMLIAAWLGLMTPSAYSQNEPATATPPSVSAQDSTGGSFSISSPDKMAAWQKHLTLGPGDVINVSIYSLPDTARNNLSVGPDGRLNYLQARDIVASGLSVEELRAKLEEVLSKYYRPPLRVIVVPQAFHSKKYYVLGNVVQKGVFPLDRPVTMIEAIARAQGFASSNERRHTLMLADLSRSFLVRKNKAGEFEKENLDFEALFLQGDLSQNIALAPDDYLYFPPLDLNEVYVLGEVTRPGIAVHTSGLTLLRAIIMQGGFLDKAYRSKVLVVRGSLKQPQSFVVNINKILSAEALDFKLEPRDIVYVSRRPWAKAEELLEMAVTEFFRAAIIGWTGQNVGPLIKDPIVK